MFVGEGEQGLMDCLLPPPSPGRAADSKEPRLPPAGGHAGQSCGREGGMIVACPGLGSANAVGTETLAGAAAPAADEQEMRDTGGPVFPRFPGPRIRPIVPALASQRATAVVKLESWE